jgi:hypothetical protein|tara:strand:- start:73 stop:657 length:585 start_codon:yes stop_codon:yes gene_type:complete
MATRTIIINGYNYDAASSATVLFDGVEVFAGTLTASVDAVPAAPLSGPASDPVELFKFDFNNADDSQMTSHTLSVECNAGHIDVGEILSHCNPGVDRQAASLGVTLNADGKWYWNPGNGAPYGDGSDTADCERTNILKDGEALFLLDADTDLGIGEPQGGKTTPVWTGWSLKLEAGETLTCGVRVPEIINATLP